MGKPPARQPRVVVDSSPRAYHSLSEDRRWGYPSFTEKKSSDTQLHAIETVPETKEWGFHALMFTSTNGSHAESHIVNAHSSNEPLAPLRHFAAGLFEFLRPQPR
jgi:hypothetical protein